jgi:hypothetical protein
MTGYDSNIEEYRLSAPLLSFFEGNGGTQDNVCDLDVTNQVVRFKSHASCDNDETRSLVIFSVHAGTTIEVFENPDCRPNDDWTQIIVKRAVSQALVSTYEQSFENDDLLVIHHHANGLDGKVSCVRITTP